MLTDLKTILAIAEEKGCAIGAFNVYNMETVMGVAKAAEEAKSPVIFQVYSRLFENEEGEYLAPVILRAIEKLSVPAVFHLDHGASVDVVQKALRLGATGIMRDASMLPLEENIEKTKLVVDLCSPVNVQVEGELGQIGMAAKDNMGEYTKVDEAQTYAQQTEIAALAILVGTAHGRYKQAPILDIQRIADIKKATGIPLVLHGGSGVADDQIQAAIAAGIRKINFGTDLCYTFLDTVFDTSRKLVAVDLFMKESVEQIKNFALSKIRLLGSEGLYA